MGAPEPAATGAKGPAMRSPEELRQGGLRQTVEPHPAWRGRCRRRRFPSTYVTNGIMPVEPVQVTGLSPVARTSWEATDGNQCGYPEMPSNAIMSKITAETDSV